MYKRYVYIVLCLCFLFVLSGCLDERVDVGSNNEPSVQLSISGTQDISVYSTATTSENTIGDCVVLLYRGAVGSNYVDKEVIDVPKIVNNGSASPMLPQLTIEPQTGDRMYVICNAHLLSIPTTVTENDFNTVFRPNDGYYFGGEQLPMFGKISSWSSTEKTCVMTREVAKIQVQMGTSVPDNTPNFTLDRLFYVVYNGGDSCNIEPSPSGTVLGTPGSASRFTGMSVHRLLQTENATEKELNVYLHEYPSSTKDGAGNTINDNDFAVGRTFILLKKALSTTDTMYYRLDFYDSSTKKYLDVKRNCHYLFTINKVRSEGYRTADEAIVNPGSNLEYTISVDNPYKDITSNGQYALSFDRDTVRFFEDDTIVLGLSLTTVGAVDVSTAYVELWDETSQSVLTMPDFFSVNGVTQVSNKIQLGNQTVSKEFGLKCQGVTHSDQAAMEALKGKYFRVHIGNITKKIPISYVPVSFYYGTANCIEQPPVAGTYSFDVTPHTTASDSYSYKNTPDNELGQPLSAAILWSDVSTTHITNPSITHNADGTHTLNYTSSGDAGNAVIAIYSTVSPTDPGAKILWSFHIWTVNRPADEWWATTSRTSPFDNIPNTYCLMGLNLGATSNDIPTTANGMTSSAFGLHYQWGRKDPFVGCRVANSAGTDFKIMYNNSGIVARQVVASSATTGTIIYTINNPMAFLTSTGDWKATRDDALWGAPTTDNNIVVKGKKSIYDPCPAGYQVPPKDAFMRIVRNMDGWGAGVINYWNTSPAGTYPSANRGAVIFYQDNQAGATTFLPGVNALTGTSFGSSAGAGLYWTNTNNGGESRRCSFGNTTWNPVWSGRRMHGYAVRCMKN